MKYYLMALLSMLVFSSSALAANKIAPFVGLWTVAFEQTMQAVKKSPKYNPKDAEKMPAMIKRLMGKMKIKISKNKLTYLRGRKERAFDIKFKKGNRTSATVTANADGEKFTISLKLIEGKYMNLRSSGSDNMDYYIWEKTN